MKNPQPPSKSENTAVAAENLSLLLDHAFETRSFTARNVLIWHLNQHFESLCIGMSVLILVSSMIGNLYVSFSPRVSFQYLNHLSPGAIIPKPMKELMDRQGLQIPLENPVESDLECEERLMGYSILSNGQTRH